MASISINGRPARSRAFRWASTLLGWLVNPLARVDDVKERRRRMRLSGLMLLLTCYYHLGIPFVGEEQGRIPILMTGLLLFIGYVISRTRYHYVGRFLALSVPAFPMIPMVLFSQARDQIALQMPWLILPLLIASLVLSLRRTIIVAAGYVIYVIVLAHISVLPVPNIASSIAFMTLVVVFVLAITASRQRDQREIEKQLEEIKRTEAALRESEEKFYSAFKNSPSAIFIVSVADGTFTEINESFYRFSGYSPGEVIGRSPIELSFWADENVLNHMAAELQEKQRVYNYEAQYRLKSGEIRVGLFSAEFLTIGGRPCVIFNIIDITERKRAEQLQRDEISILTHLSQGAELSEVLDALIRMGEIRDPSIKGSVLLVDPVQKILVQAAGPSLSDDFKQLLANGLPIGEGKGACGTAAHRKRRVVVPDIGSSPFFDKNVAAVTRRNAILSCWSQPIISSRGELLGTIANYSSRVGEPDAQNLTVLEWSARVAAIAIERKRAEVALRESEEKFSKAFHASPDIIIVSRTRDSRFIEVNDSFIRLTGFSRAEVLKDPTVEYRLLGNLTDRDRIMKLLQEPGRIRNQEVSFQVRKGEVRTLLFSSEPINFGGEPCKITIAKDITEIKRTQEELKQALSSLEKSSAQLEATNRELETFSYSVSHDLRTPLRGIDGFSQALLEDFKDKLDEQGRDYLARLRQASQKMGALIDGLLKLSRLTRSEMHQETVDLGAIAQEIFSNLKEAYPERVVEFTTTGDLTVRGDPPLLRVLLENLIGNAWKFSTKNPHAKIEFGNMQNNGKTEFFVRDNGVGFDMAYAGKLFGAFQRLHSPEEFPGTGIGLATAQRIINRHGGMIRAEGEVGKGATFYFTLN